MNYNAQRHIFKLVILFYNTFRRLSTWENAFYILVENETR